MLKDLTINDFWHIEDGDRAIPVISTGNYAGHYNPKADKKRWKIARNDHRSKHYTNHDTAKDECKRRNLKDFGICFHPQSGPNNTIIVYGNKGQYLQTLDSEVYNANWNKLQSLETLDSNQTQNLKHVVGDCFVWCDRMFIEDYNYTAYSAQPHSTNLVYVYDSVGIVAIYQADNGDQYDTVGEMDYVIETRNAIMKQEIDSLL